MVDVDSNVKLASEELSKTKIPVVQAEILPQEGKNSQKKSKKHSNELSVHFSTTSPVIPAVIIKTLNAHKSSLIPKKRSDLITIIAKYWALKKESRRGAALLKRLHLEVCQYFVIN
jgi:hypothetical protein